MVSKAANSFCQSTKAFKEGGRPMSQYFPIPLESIAPQLSKVELPSYVLESSNGDWEEVDNLPNHCFGDPQLRNYPCHTKAACYLSHAVFAIHGSDDTVRERLEKAAQFWNATKDIADLYSSLHRMEKQAEVGPSFTITYVNNGHEEKREYPLRNGSEVLKAASWLENNRDDLPYAARKQIAERILERADELAVGLPTEQRSYLGKQAGQGLCDPSEVVNALRRRALLSPKHKDLNGELCKMASMIEENPTALLMDPVRASNLCGVLDRFDHVTGLNRKYGSIIRRPEETVFRHDLFEAGEMLKEACALRSGTIYEEAQFGHLKTADVRDVLGSGIADQVADGLRVDPTKMAAIASALPTNAANRLDDLMASCGQSPSYKEAHNPHRLDQNDFEALSAINDILS